jgi:UDP-glucose 4-epimerase
LNLKAFSMTILVTGGAGYIGSHMVYELIDLGEAVVVVDNLSTGDRSLLPDSVPLIEGSTGDWELISRVLRDYEVSGIIHFAASVVVPESLRDPLGYYRNNTLNTCKLLDIAVQSKVKNFIFSSTAAVYGNAERVPVREDDFLRPLSPYGNSKLMCEVMLRDSAQAYGLRYVVLRYFNVAGADPKGRTGQATPQATHLIKVACEAAVGKRSKVEVFGSDYPTPDGTGVRDYIHVSDLAQAHLAALSYLRNGGASDTFNCGYGRGVSVGEVLSAVKRISGVEFPTVAAARRPGDPALLIADTTRIRTALQWMPRFQDLDTIVSHALAWERRGQRNKLANDRPR